MEPRVLHEVRGAEAAGRRAQADNTADVATPPRAWRDFRAFCPNGPFVFFGIAYAFSLIGVAYDQWSRGRIHRVY
jgi:hypothetical protein